MTIVEFPIEADTVLDHVDQHIRQLTESGVEVRYIIAGQSAYRSLCRAISVRNKRGKGSFETYNFISIVVDPFRDNTVLVVPAPGDCCDGVAAYRIDDDS